MSTTIESRPRTIEKAEPVCAGVLAEFGDAEALVAAARRVRQGGFSVWDAHSPYPIHGIDEAMGTKPTILPWAVLAGGLAGGSAAMLMQWWMNAVDYPFLISGKPLFSIPASIPVAFEVTILLAAFVAFFGMLWLNGLPLLSNPMFGADRFRRATIDGFFITIDASDPAFDVDETQQLMKSFGATGVEVVAKPRPTRQLPRPLIFAGLIVSTLALIPPVMIAKARTTTSDKPRIHPVQDMDFQPKFRSQTSTNLFPDGRAMRPQVAGTIARGELEEDDQFFRGIEPPGRRMTPPLSVTAAVDSATSEQGGVITTPAYVTDIPLEITDDLMRRGRERYNIFCANCHGLGGDGDGLVTLRALELEQGTWVKPIALHAASVSEQPAGKLFGTITNGIRKMPGYASQIPPKDRWAIVLYLRALQRSRNASPDDVPEDVLFTLREVQ